MRQGFIKNKVRYPLTTPQQNIWNLQKYYPGTSIANVGGIIRFASVYNYEAFNRAINLLIENNDALRLCFSEENGQPYQTIAPYQSENIAEYDMRGKSQVEIDALFTELVQEPFNIKLSPVYRFAAVRLDSGQCGIFLCLHHLICDAWSISLITEEVLRHYHYKLFDDTVTTPSFIDTILAEQKYLSSQYQKDKAYWDDTFAERPHLCRIKDTTQTRTSKTDRYTYEPDSSFCKEIAAYCKQEAITPAVLFESALFAYLHRTNEYATPITIGVPVLNRNTVAEKKTIGMFISTALLSVPIDENGSIAKLCQTIKQKHLETFRHQKYPVSHILQSLRTKDTDVSTLYDVVVSYQNARIDGLDTNVTAAWYPNGHSEVPLCLHIEDMCNTGGYKLHFDYQTAVLSSSETTLLCAGLLYILRQTIDNKAFKVCDIQILSPAEYQKVIFDFNDTTVDYPKGKCIHQFFEEQAAQMPDKTAVIFENMEYTYRQIDEMANSLAHILRDKGVGRNDIVAIIAKRSYKIVVAQLAILKAGGAYMPIDPNYPAGRITFMLDDAKCKTAFVLGAAVDGIDMADDNLFSGKSDSLENINSSDDLCYVIYTSGSTGTPKGAMLTHRNFMNFCNNNNNNNNIQVMIATTCKFFLHLGAFTFDMAPAEVYLTLLNRHTLILANENQIDNADEIAKLIDTYHVDFTLTTPTRVLTYMSNLAFSVAMRKLKVLALGGENLTPDMLDSLKFHTDAVILNGYGPTETTQGCTWTAVGDDITIGKPIANTQIFILDKYQNPMPIGAIGELCISGDGVGRGYLNRPELTAEKFVPNPFIEGKRMYKTGDLARWRTDGYIEYIGRMDNQVKIRGLRIELGEIESAISQFEGVRQAAVVDKKDNSGRQYICAYYIGGDIDIKVLKKQLAKTLPQYMIPHFFTRMDCFPTTGSGKTDRKAFTAPDFSNLLTTAEYIAPVTEREKTFVGIIEAMLGISHIGMDDSFFDLGGDSLKAIEFTARAHNSGFVFTAQDVFEFPTPAALLKHIFDGDSKMARYQADAFADIHKLLESNKINDNTPFKRPLGNMLITGATGWLGAHVLDAFLSSESGVAYCLVRGADLADSQNRLNTTLADYFGDKYADNIRIAVLCGDIFSKITAAPQIETIIHCAANVKHYGDYKHFYDVNVSGTENMIALAKEKGARLIHISTASVSGSSFEQTPDFPPTVFDETKLYIGQPLDNVYVRSKFESEVAVLQARLEGQDAIVIRVGNLANRRFDLKFQKNYNENAMLARLKVFMDLGIYPDSMDNFPLEFSPVDDTAKAILKLTQNSDTNYSVFHACHNNPIRFTDFAEISGIQPVSIREFMQALSNAGKDPKTAHIYEAFIHDIDTEGKLIYNSNITLNNAFTGWYLKSLGFDWPEIDVDYLKRYIRYFSNIGYWRA